MSVEVIEEEIKYKLKEKYKDYYIYETHLHTSQGSACAQNTGKEMARACKEYGYTGTFVTDHFYYGNTAVPRKLPWNKWVDLYERGYYDAKEEGDKIGLQVFFGWESCYAAMEFLIYGMTPEWLKENKEIRDCSVKEQYRIISEAGGLVIQAHPFREADYIFNIVQYPDDVDGTEVLNISNGVKTGYGANPCPFDDKALEYAKLHNHVMTAGSDVHSTRLFGCGMGFDRKLADAADFVSLVKQGKGVLIK